jgi:hypothetical protein
MDRSPPEKQPEPMNDSADLSRDPPSFNPSVATLLTLCVPGTGHFYKGQVNASAIWLVVVIGGYIWHWVPGSLLHLLCLVSVLGGGPKKTD